MKRPAASCVVVLVDWLGRGGIAQTTEAWAWELTASGRQVLVVTRPGRELANWGGAARTGRASTNRVLAHRAVAAAAVEEIRRVRPQLVVVQNYVLPVLEAIVDRAARRVGARLVRVVHDDRLHSRWAGSSTGLLRLLRRADVVIAHSSYVAERAQARIGRGVDVDVLPHPAQVGMLATARADCPLPPPRARLRALHFGTVHRAYKGRDTVDALAADPPSEWELAVVGPGAARCAHALSVDGYMPTDGLLRTIETSAATVLPYRFATQSGAVVLAQALGSVPVATRVGGIPEQVEDGETGLLLSRDASLGAWRDALAALADDEERNRMANAGRRAVWEAHGQFVAAVTELAS